MDLFVTTIGNFEVFFFSQIKINIVVDLSNFFFCSLFIYLNKTKFVLIIIILIK
jgi:hypothetical protein